MGQEDGTLRSVMIIDDDLGYAESLADLLQLKGYTVLYVDTPERALAALRDPPDDGARAPVALVDVRLGGIESGVDLIPRLRAEHPELICVLMTTGIDSQTAIAALRLAKEKAEAANRAKSGFLSTMSHELRTPLNAIIGFSDMMVREVLGTIGNEQYRGYVADIHDSGTHLLQIINDILDLSRAEDGKLELSEEVFDLRETIRSVRQLIGARIGDGGLSESVELSADLPLLRADERKTKQVLLNLVSNAVEFTPPGGHVEIASRFDPETGLILTVSDTGIGIAPGDL